MNVELAAVSADQKSVLANLLQFYCYDFSEFDGEELTPHGTFTYGYLDHYFTDDDREACLITADGRLAGFTMTRRLEDGTRSVAEFFVVRRHRRLGVGRAAARQLLHRHPGRWRLAFDHANRAAARFWPDVVAAIADGPVEHHDAYPPEAARPETVLRFRVAVVTGDGARRQGAK
jgi:predicted acetyltransferase